MGFTTVLAREPFTELDDPPGHYALITDLVVLEPYRGHGIGRRLYPDAGFQPHLELLNKRW